MDLEQAPTTVKEVGIHIYYMSKNMKELSDKFDAALANHVTKSEFAPVKKLVDEHDTALKVLANGEQRKLGVTDFLKLTAAFLVGLGAVIGALWWLPELIKRIASN